MAWTPISSTQTDAGSIVNQTLMDSIRTNLDDLNDRVSAIGTPSDQNIYDNFTSALLSTRVIIGGGAVGHEDPYTWDFRGTGSHSLATRHTCALTQAGGVNDYASIMASSYKMRFALDLDHTIVFECRHKSSQSDITEYWTFGFQDEAMIGTVNLVKDRTDFMGFIQGTGVANTYRAQCDDAGAGPTVVVDDEGDASAWTVLRIELTFAGATQQVEFFVDGTSVGTSTTNIPNGVVLRPMVGTSDGAGARTQNFDYIHAFWATQPLSA